MITNRKRIAALLAAGILAATTSAVYGAQLPQDTNSVAASSSSESLYMNITETSHQLTPTRFTASYEGSGSHQFRTMNSTVTIEREVGMNTSKFETVAVRQYGSAPYYISVDESISLNPGERLRVTISSRASVFDGYEYVGDVFGYEEFIYTL